MALFTFISPNDRYLAGFKYIIAILSITSRPGAGYAPHIFVHIGFKTQSSPRNVALLRNFIFSYAELHAAFKHAKYHFEDLETP